MKKESIAIILGKLGPKKPEDAPMEDAPVEDIREEGLHSCAVDLIKAVKKEDPKAVSMALKHAFTVLGAMEDEQSEEEYE